jgi:hypothetical protein
VLLILSNQEFSWKYYAWYIIRSYYITVYYWRCIVVAFLLTKVSLKIISDRFVPPQKCAKKWEKWKLMVIMYAKINWLYFIYCKSQITDIKHLTLPHGKIENLQSNVSQEPKIPGLAIAFRNK